MISNTTLWTLLVVINAPVYVLIGKIVFGTWEDFWEAVRFWFTPDLFSAFMGEFWEDVWAELKLFVFLAVCAGCVYGEYALVQRFM
jgi:hypothetical protein